jgi:hypothetical protein
MRVGAPGIDQQARAERRFRAERIAEFREHNAKIIPGFAILRIASYELPKLLSRLVRFAEGIQRIREIETDGWKLATEGEGLSVRANRFLESSVIFSGAAEAKARLDCLPHRCEGQDPAIITLELEIQLVARTRLLSTPSCPWVAKHPQFAVRRRRHETILFKRRTD